MNGTQIFAEKADFFSSVLNGACFLSVFSAVICGQKIY